MLRSRAGAAASPAHAAPAHAAFRLIITADVPDFSLAPRRALAPPLPLPALRAAVARMLEAPADFVAAVTRLLRSHAPAPIALPSSPGAAAADLLRPRLRLLLAWLHAVVLQRRRYAGTGVGVGWTRAYDFSVADHATAVAIADALLARGDLGPAALVTALRELVRRVVYGGRLETRGDARAMDALCESLLADAALGEGHPLTLAASQALSCADDDELPTPAAAAGATAAAAAAAAAATAAAASAAAVAAAASSVCTPEPTLRDGEAIVAWVEATARVAASAPPAWFGLPAAADEELTLRYAAHRVRAALAIVTSAV